MAQPSPRLGQMRDPSSLPMMTEVSCYGDGPKNRRCYPKNQGAACNAGNVDTFACDLRNLKVPPYYVPTDTTATFAAYRQLPVAQQMYAQLVAARRSFMKALPILYTYSKQVLTTHLLPFKGVSMDTQPQTLLPVNVPSNSSPDTWVTLHYPNFATENAYRSKDFSSDQDVQSIVNTVGNFKLYLTSIIHDHGNEAKDEIAERRRYPSVGVNFRTQLSPGKLLADLVDTEDDIEHNGGMTFRGSQPLYTSSITLSGTKYLVNGPFWRVENRSAQANPKYVNERYRIEPQNYYRTGRGMLLAAFEHLRAAALLFLQIRNDQQTGTFNVLEDYEYNLLLVAARMLQYCNLVEMHGWQEYYTDTTSKKLFKGKILRFKSTGDWLVYHVFVEVLTQQAEIFKRQNKSVRKWKKKAVYALPTQQLNARGATKATAINVDLAQAQVQGGAHVFLVT